MKYKDRRSSNRILRTERSKKATKETETCIENDIKVGLKRLWYYGVNWIVLARYIVTGDPLYYGYEITG
jgi:hypothetical protein